jgi:hypothetical protein
MTPVAGCRLSVVGKSASLADCSIRLQQGTNNRQRFLVVGCQQELRPRRLQHLPTTENRQSTTVFSLSVVSKSGSLADCSICQQPGTSN